MDCAELDEIIYGRIEPHIYAFNTNEIPNYLKIGDTYRPVKVRLSEWKHIFPNLEKKFEDKAIVNDDVYFRDYSVHAFLEEVKQKTRLTEEQLKSIYPEYKYYSNEFFKNAEIKDIEEAIADIKENYQVSDKYVYYSTNDRSTRDFVYQRSSEYWKPRPNQEEAIEKFVSAVKHDRSNLLMYAVMRFGKSFTSMCCAAHEDINAKFVVVVSAKADVRTEWKKTVEIPANFSDFDFIESKDLVQNENIVKEKLESDRKLVCFLTLQDFQGEELKEKHKQVFTSNIDLLIVDETHFGARADSYGKVLRSPGYQEDKGLKKQKSLENDFNESIEASEVIEKTFTNVKTKLHLSGTPYRILMGSEFQPDDIISFCQFADIVHEQEQWELDNLKSKSPKEEWENPYYGFPQMIRFAFNPNESSRKKLEELRKNGSTYAFSALFKPRSIVKDDDNNLHKKFENEREILDLLEVIDGTKEDNELLGFLDYSKIKEGKMCRHIVAVLPYCASCDALEELINNNKDKFKNLSSYKIINISGVERNSYKKIEDIKAAIKKAEADDIKTLTLTVNRMLTGSTVEQWDTMLYFKDTSSPQEYDQAIFRLQNQYIRTMNGSDGNSIKFNMKPQTLLVDFIPMRLFQMQEIKSKIYNVNTDESGNSKLENRLSEELRISPIIASNKNKLIQITPSDILQAVSEYSRNRGVAEETLDIPVDYKLMEDALIKSVIEMQGGLGTKEGFSITASDDPGYDLDIEEDDHAGEGEDDPDNESTSTNTDFPPETEDSIKSLIQKWRMYYARILFFAFLTKNKVISLQQIIEVAEVGENPRIIKNLGLDKQVLINMQRLMDKFGLSQLDYKIQNLNTLANDMDDTDDCSSQDDFINTKLDRAMTAIRKIGRLSESEVVTPNNICDDMINLISHEQIENAIRNHKAFLDINSKLAEFGIAVYKRCTQELKLKPEVFRDLIYAIPSSKITYEFTRRIYEILDLNLNNISEKFTSYDLLKIKNQNETLNYKRITQLLNKNEIFKDIYLTNDAELFENQDGAIDMKFDFVVGNPPYQEMDGGHGTSAKPIYHEFVNIAKENANTAISMIMPSRWFVGGKGLDEFRTEMLNNSSLRTIVDFPNVEDVFHDVDISGGVSYFLLDKLNPGPCIIKNMINNKIYTEERNLNEYDILIRDNRAIKILEKIKAQESVYLDTKVSSRKPFGLATNYKPVDSGVPCWFIQKIGRKFAAEDKIDDANELLNKWKFLAPKAPIAGQTDFSKPVGFYYDGNTIVARPGECCTESFIVLGAFETEEEVKNYKSYILTKIARFLLLQAVISQDVTKKCFCFVPDLGTYDREYTDEYLRERWGITEEEWNYIDSRICNIKGQGK